MHIPKEDKIFDRLDGLDGIKFKVVGSKSTSWIIEILESRNLGVGKVGDILLLDEDGCFWDLEDK